MREKSYRTLELDRVLTLLSGQAVSKEAKEKSLALTPAEYFEDVRRLQEETSAARAMIGVHGSPVFSGVKPVGGGLKRAEMGGVLNTRELLDIAALLRAARACKSYAGSDTSPRISYLFRGLQANKFLEEKIFICIPGEDEIADAASHALADIRRHMRQSAAKVREVLQKIITSSSTSKFLQEPIITQRADRFVVPVKAEHRNELNGLTHDVSSSGATYFIEPMQVVKLNNDLRELAAKEQKEIERVLAELSADCAAHAEDIMRDYDILVALDCIFARGKLSYDLDCVEPVLNQQGRIHLKKARHPLLPKGTVVPTTIRLGLEFDTLVITGPNTGGKTVTLKTLGLLTLMAACGLHIPADDGSEICHFQAVLADIGDEQSIEQSLSTFSSHMKNIVNILDILREFPVSPTREPNALILFDELGAGTDPVEGAALAVSIIQYARKLDARVAATTHYAELKEFALTTPGVENASCEFDVETLRPTYKVLIGVPGRSNAFAISQRLGLDLDIIEAAKSRVSTENVRFEDVLNRLEVQRQALEEEKTRTEVLRRQAEDNAKISENLRRQVEKEKETSAERARAEARRLLDAARRESDELLQSLTELHRKNARDLDAQALNALKSEARRRLNAAEEELGGGITAEEERQVPSRPLKAGDTVRLKSIGTSATVLTAPDKDGVVSLQAGIMKITARQDEVTLIEDETQKKAAKPQTSVSRTATASREADLRGMTSEEAILSMELFLDTAMLAHLQQVTIIHGKGTGALRSAVHAALRKNPIVKSFRLGRYGEGENGVTIVELK